jgi:hypothetical protein
MDQCLEKSVTMSSVDVSLSKFGRSLFKTHKARVINQRDESWVLRDLLTSISNEVDSELFKYDSKDIERVLKQIRLTKKNR